MRFSLKKTEDFKKVYDEKKSYATKNIVLYILKNVEMESNRLGISVSKKVGNSVVRHKLKRLMREVFRKNLDSIYDGYDFVVVFRVGSHEMNFFELNMIQNQHFYPLSILDYANMMLKYMKGEISNLPIMSLDSHDYNFCDFNCKDCLAVDTRNWAKDNLGFTNFDIDHYEKVLKEIARYSKARGLDSIRFEMSGEGNPDMYPHRARLIKYAYEKCNMKCVYITSGSRLNEETIDALAKYAYYIRISLPGINEESYKKYSAQKNIKDPFTYKKAIELIKKLAQKRKEYGREGELMIGARTCMRPENEGSYMNAAKELSAAGADSFSYRDYLWRVLRMEGWQGRRGSYEDFRCIPCVSRACICFGGSRCPWGWYTQCYYRNGCHSVA